AAIYVLIAGTVTPIAIVGVSGWEGWTLFGLLWTIATVGVTATIFKPFQSRWASTLLYLVMGWIPLFFVKPIFNSLSPTVIVLSFVGGVLYTVGAFFYMFDWPHIHQDYFGAHELWHIFTLLASGTHFIMVAGVTT
ncbi:MAG: hemolysin III family protein, partial [bacterium]